VAVAVYDRPHEAHLARLRLEAEGIECALQDEHMGGLTGPPIFGVRLHVQHWQSGAARRVLDDCAPRSAAAASADSADWVTGDLGAPRCPRCGSLRVEPDRWTAAGRVRAWLSLGLGLPFRRHDRGCGHCGHRWRGAPASGEEGTSPTA
jgi:hypothetical protein